MENCLSKDQIICTFDLKDESGLYYEEMVLEWKQAAAHRHLSCMECGAHVYLAAGPIKEPYFAHYDLEECDYGKGHESEELKKGKRLLYRLLKRSFPKCQVQARFRMKNGMYSTLYCQTNDSKSIAVDFRLQSNSLEKFRLRDLFYQGNKIIPFYVMGIKQDKATIQLDWYQNLIQSTMGYLAFLDTDTESMVLKKNFGYRLGKARKFLTCKKTYPLAELQLNEDCQLLCDFNEECQKVEQQILREKEQEQSVREKARKRKEQYYRMEAIENEGLEKYRRLKEQEIREKTLDPNLLEKCRRMIDEGNAHLVSKKYYDVIMGNRNT